MSLFRRIIQLLTGTRDQPAVATPRPTPTAPTPPPVAQPARPASPAPRPVLPVAPAATRKQPENKTLNLDASQFTPLSGSEIKSQLAGKGSSSWDIFRGQGLAWWGNRSIIPPASDPRTQFIDRGMVGQGLVTAEELVEMHAIGDEMLRLRPELDQAATIGEQAVQRSQEEKEAIKKQKKAEAEERKKKHAQAVAHRKATDIIFLGRGVSKGLADRRANIEKLQAAGLPVLATPRDVAAAMGLTIPQLRWLAFHSAATTRPHYVRFTIPKRSGGTRDLAAPHQKLAAAQEWVLTQVLQKLPVHDAAHGFVSGRSTRTNAMPHLEKYAVINCDLKDFFPSITVDRVIGLFKEMGYSPAAATILALICTEPPRRVVDYAGNVFHVATGKRCLPQGACTSPAISNLISRRLDSRLSGISRKLGFVYTRYADDLSFSAPVPTVSRDDPAHPDKKIGYLLARIRHIASDEGFAVNEKKTRILRRHRSQRVTGIVVNSAEPTIPRATRRRLRAMLHQAKKTGATDQNLQQKPYSQAQLRGMIAYVHMVNPRQAQPLKEAM